MTKSDKILKEHIDFLKWQQSYGKKNTSKFYDNNIVYKILTAETIYEKQIRAFKLLPLIASKQGKNTNAHFSNSKFKKKWR